MKIIKKEGRMKKTSLKRSKAEWKEIPQKLQDQLEAGTATERAVNKQLHHEIEQHKQVERVIQNALTYSQSIVDTVRESLLVLDTNLRVVSASRSFYQTFKVRPEETEKKHIYELGNRQWDIPKLRELLEDILPKTESFDNFEVEHNFPDLGRRIMLLNARKIYREFDHTHLILLAIEDVTTRKELEERLNTLASHDELTGCVNFRSIMELLEKEIARTKRYHKEFSLIIVDIDHFKRINDEHGHLAGNDALAAFANVVKNSIRSIDIVGRYGGDEFMIILPETDPQASLVVLERIRSDLKGTKITSQHLKDVKEFTLQFSAGIAAFPCNAEDLKGLIRVADNALRQAKLEGRNRVVLERRRSVRFNPMPGTRMEVANSSGKEDLLALNIANISKEGMLFLSSRDILEEELLCRIYRPKDESPFELTCKVKHKSKPEHGPCRIGVYFPDMPESVKEKLSNCIESPKELN